MANQNPNFIMDDELKYQCEDGCPPHMIFGTVPAEQFQFEHKFKTSKQSQSQQYQSNEFQSNEFQSNEFKDDPLTGFNSMTSSYSSTHSGDNSPTGSGSNVCSEMQSLGNLISDGYDKGYFPIENNKRYTQEHQYHYHQNRGHYQNRDHHQNKNHHQNRNHHQNMQMAPHYGEQHVIHITRPETYMHQPCTMDGSNMVILEPVNNQFYNDCIIYQNGSDGASSDNFGQNSPESYKPESIRLESTHLKSTHLESTHLVPDTSHTMVTSQLSQENSPIYDILENVDEHFRSKENSPASSRVTTPVQVKSPESIVDQRTLTPESFSPQSVKRMRGNNSNKTTKSETPSTIDNNRKEKRKATNRKASANYRAKQVKRQHNKEELKIEQENIRKQLELDNHAMKMQIQYMMKTFSDRIKTLDI
jgi:hypothetical protein